MRPQWTLFARAFAAAGAGIAIASVFFPNRADLLGMFLASLGLSVDLERMLDANRRAIWEESQSSYRANSRLAIDLLALFLGVFAAYFLAAYLLPQEARGRLLGFQLERYGAHYRLVTDIWFGSFREILVHNAVVLSVVFLLAILYQDGGARLILVWNAAIWGSVFGYLIGNQEEPIPFETVRYAIRTLLVLSPHLVTESAAYVLGALSGIFAIRGLRRHPLGSDRPRRVLVAGAPIGATAVALLGLAAWIESTVTPWLVRRIVPQPLFPRPF